MAPDEPAPVLRAEVIYSAAPGAMDRFEVRLPYGATLHDAVARAGLLIQHPEWLDERPSVGVWGKAREWNDPLRDGDRVEIYRPLQVDPKEARRVRYRSHREKATRR